MTIDSEQHEESHSINKPFGELIEPISFEQFGELYSQLTPNENFNKFINMYNSSPAIFIRSLANLVPIGFLSSMDYIISENIQKQENKKLLTTLYQLYTALFDLKDDISNFEKSYLEDNIPTLTEKYFYHCRNTYQIKMIEAFRKIWYNGIIKKGDSLDLKVLIFDLVGSLTVD